ncbi:phage head morphogenesis protein [Streptococcus bovimastitidis]|uniref:Phage head morphogenesis protein n=1 Tax=Streptococcus bovimastitidis TaxID=1856638 RepID=A0A1L8MKD3_9STRE|nr:minor capsid protein [Streptococcus bovimastitidis]OJF71242.1 phage head morphogenesis protein [Streptococcus bovimastitidis]
MDNHKYWKQRQTQLWNNLERNEQALQEKMAKYYSEQLFGLEKEIGSYFAKYGKNNVIEYRDLLQQMSKAEKDVIYRNFDGFAERYPQYKKLAPVRNSIYKLDRLQGLELSIKSQQLEIGAIEQEELTKHLAKTFKDGYQETAKVMGFTFDKVALQTIIDDDWINQENFSASIWNNKDKLVAYLINDLKAGIIRGDSYDKLLKQLRDRFSKQSNYNLHRLLRTEGTYVNNQAMMKPFEDSGLYDEYEFVAVLDSHTSSVCKGLDGQKFLMKSKQVGVNFPPMHPGCRSSFAMVIPDDYEQRYKEKNK